MFFSEDKKNLQLYIPVKTLVDKVKRLAYIYWVRNIVLNTGPLILPK